MNECVEVTRKRLEQIEADSEKAKKNTDTQ